MDLHEATYQDAEGKTFNQRFRAADDMMAKEFANACALKSDGKWIGLKKIVKLALPYMTTSGAQTVDNTPNALQAAAAGSDIQSRGRLTYLTADPSNFIPVEIPSVLAAYLSKGSRTSTTDPLAASGTDKLRSENNASATAMKSAHYLKRVRRS